MTICAVQGKCLLFFSLNCGEPKLHEIFYDLFEIMRLEGERGRITAPFYHRVSFLTLRDFRGRGEVFRSRSIVNTYLEEFDIVADEIRRGLKESEYVPLRCTLDVMRILDTVRSQIGLEYDDLEQ